MDNVFNIWTVSIVVALGLDISAYIVLRLQWKKRGLTMIDDLLEKISNKLGQVAKTWQERLQSLKPKPAVAAPMKLMPAIEAQSAQLQSQPSPDAQPVQVDEPQPGESIPASVETVGDVKRVEFSMDVPLNSGVRISIASTAETGVKVEKRRIR